MMCEMMMSPGVGWTMAAAGVLLLVLVLFAIAALAKYVLTPSWRERAASHG